MNRFPKKAEKLAEKGLNNKEISEQPGIASSTYFDYKKRNFGVFGLYKKGRKG